MQSPLEKIIFQKKDAPGVLSIDTGIMFYKRKDALEWLSFEYKNHYEVYLLLDDMGEPPNRVHITSGFGLTLEQARNTAVKNMENEVFNKVH